MKKKYRIFILLTLILFIILTACQEEDVDVFLIQDTGMEITHLTTDIIEADTVIAVRFREEQVKDEFLGKELSADVFKFTPEIKGKAYRNDTRTVVFEPAAPLYQKMNYHGILNLAEISPEIEEGEVVKLEFHFQTLGQKIADWNPVVEFVNPVL